LAIQDQLDSPRTLSRRGIPCSTSADILAAPMDDMGSENNNTTWALSVLLSVLSLSVGDI
jgi:hypothetical protein